MNEVKLTNPYIGIIYQIVDKELKHQQDVMFDLYNLSPDNITNQELIKLGELSFLKNYLLLNIK